LKTVGLGKLYNKINTDLAMKKCSLAKSTAKNKLAVNENAFSFKKSIGCEVKIVL